MLGCEARHGHAVIANLSREAENAVLVCVRRERDGVGRTFDQGAATCPCCLCRETTYWPWDRVRAICANVAPLDKAISRCSRAKHCHKGVFSEEFRRTPFRLTSGYSVIDYHSQTPFSAKLLWECIQRFSKLSSVDWPKLQLPCYMA